MFARRVCFVEDARVQCLPVVAWYVSHTHTVRELLSDSRAARRMFSYARGTCRNVCCLAVCPQLFLHGYHTLSCMLYARVEAALFY